MPHNRERRNDDQEDPGQTHLNSDAKIADDGHPQGAPLPIVFSRRYALGRAPTRRAPTYCLLSALCPGEGTHKGRPYQFSSLGVMPWGGHPQGAPLPILFSRRFALLSALCPGEGPYLLSHKGCPYLLPLPIRRYALGRAPTRGAPTDSLLSAFCPGEGTHRLSSPGAPLPIRYALRRVPTRDAPTYCLLQIMPWGGHPQGAPLPFVFSRRLCPWGGHPQGGAPTDSLCPGEGAHKGRPYPIQAASRGFVPI